MKWNEYIGNAKRTELLPALGDGWRGSVPTIIWRLNHAVLGLTTELSEYHQARTIHGDIEDAKLLTAEEHANEEIGDLAWYTAIAWDTLKLDPELPITFNIAVDPDPYLASTIANIANQVKRAIYYSKDPDFDSLRDWVIQVRSMIEIMSRGKFEQILDRNIAKLRARYPGKWTAEQAVNRDLAAEAAALKQS